MSKTPTTTTNLPRINSPGNSVLALFQLVVLGVIPPVFAAPDDSCLPRGRLRSSRFSSFLLIRGLRSPGSIKNN